jgi:HAD superfamily hydrolase (TIGR01509 family)
VIRAVVFDCIGVLYLGSSQPFNHPVADLIRRLRPHYQIGMLSNSEQHFLEHFLTRHQSSELFDVVYGSSQSRYAKPAREIFTEVADQLDVKLSEMLFVDDSTDNISAATSYGIRSILYENPKQLEQELGEAEIQLS